MPEGYFLTRDDVMKEINFSEEQKKQFSSIEQACEREEQKLLKDGQADFASFKVLVDEMQSRKSRVLTPAQRQRLSEIRLQTEGILAFTRDEFWNNSNCLMSRKS